MGRTRLVSVTVVWQTQTFVDLKSGRRRRRPEHGADAEPLATARRGGIDKPRLETSTQTSSWIRTRRCR